MQMMTQSQLDNVAIDCKKLVLKIDTINQSSFVEFFKEFLEPFQIKLAEKELRVEIKEVYRGSQQEDELKALKV